MKRRYDLLYGIGAVVSSPVLAVSLLRTGKWRTDWRGRFGKTPPLPDDPRPTLLLHGVSVGEINATREVVARLEAPGGEAVRVVISATTNTGFARAMELYGDRHPVVRFPFDFSWMVRRFLDAIRPQAVALMELEVWPNLALECQRRAIPLAVINGRLSDSSFGNYRWARRWVRPMFQGLAAVAAQTEEYAQRFRDLGTPSERVSVTDTMKWDTVRLVDEVEGADALAADMGIDAGRPLVVAGSTGPGEEEKLIRDRPSGVQLLLVPRKPERFDEVARLSPGMRRRSQPAREPPPSPGQDLFLLDSMGELTKAYALADVAVVGRSFVPLGGSDPIEAIALGKPTIIGPHHENFREVVAAFAEGGGIRVTDRPMAAVKDLLDHPEEARSMGERGRDVIRRRQGATERHLRLLRKLLAEGPPGRGDSGQADEEAGDDHRGRRKGLGRWILAALALYMALGYLTTALRRVPTESPVGVTVPLPDQDGTLVTGVFSVHTNRSHDAVGTREQVGAAARSAGLEFVVVGDHPPDDRKPGWTFWDPVFRDQVLIEGGQELRVPEAGKILAMGVDTTYRRWTGSYGSLAALLRREGATSFVVHGRGPRSSERWVQPGTEGVQGWEVLDISEAARRRLTGPWSLYHVVTLLVGTPLGLGDEALLHLMREGFDTPTVAAYDSLRMKGPLTATAGVNVHPKLNLGPFLIPSYGSFFRTLRGNLVVEEPLPADAVAADRVLTRGLREGDLFLALGDDEAAEGFRFAVENRGSVAGRMGENVPALAGMVLRAGFDGDPGRKLVYRILRNGREEAWIRGPDLEWVPPRPGVYRVEVYAYTARLGNVFLRMRPWIFANPVGLLGAGDGTE